MLSFSALIKGSSGAASSLFFSLGHFVKINSLSMEKKNQLYNKVEKQLQMAIVTFTPISSSPSVFNKPSTQARKPVAALEIPNHAAI